MDSKGFFLGIIAAIVLFLLWRKEIGSTAQTASFQPSAAAPGGCAGGCGAGPSASAAPVQQSAQSLVFGTDGQISPGTPPLQTVAGSGSFYNANGPTPDNTFPTVPQNTLVRAGLIPYGNVPGSPTTPANQVPVRSVAPVLPYSEQGFVQHLNITGVYLPAGARNYIQ